MESLFGNQFSENLSNVSRPVSCSAETSLLQAGLRETFPKNQRISFRALVTFWLNQPIK